VSQLSIKEEDKMREGILKKLSVALLVVGINGALACDMHGKGGFVPENDLFIGVNDKNTSGMTEEVFNEVLDRVEGIYSPIISSMGKRLEVVRNWNDGTVNAYAQQTGNTWKISMFGGLARHITVTPDGFAVVACHELGHHIGGLPKKGGWFGSSWASNEGQSDYWANAKCFRKYVENDDNIEMMAAVEVPEFVTEKCMANFSEATDIAVCQRGSMAGLSLANLFRALGRTTTELKFETPDPAVVRSTDHNHPAAQCRLDTYFQGSLCDRDAYEDTNNSDVAKGFCTRSANYVDGVRPLCWFKP
jgi:hypothetical protein